MIAKLLSALESLQSTQLNLGLYTTRVTAEALRRAMAEAERTVLPLPKVEAALCSLMTRGGQEFQCSPRHRVEALHAGHLAGVAGALRNDHRRRACEYILGQ